MNKLHELAEKVIRESLRIGARQAEVVVCENRIGTARFRNKAIHQNMDGLRPLGSAPFSLKIRIINKDERLGSSSATTLNHFEESIEDAMECSRYGPELSSFQEPSKAVSLSGLYFEDTAQLSPEERGECINFMVDVATAVDNRVSFVGGLLSNVSCKAVIANSLGLEAEHAYTGGHVIITVVSKEGNREGSGFARKASRDFHSIDLEALARDSARDSISTIGYQNKPVPTGRREVIFKAEAAAEYLGTIIQQAFSVTRSARTTAKAPFGEQVFSEQLTLVDNARDLRTLSASAIDGEGTPTELLCLINHGIPENRCYDHELAKREGRQSTGHAQAPWSGFFWTGTGSGQTYLPTNQVIEPGDSRLDDLIADTRDGILVTRLRCPGSSGHTIPPDAIRADTQECWTVKDGEIAGPANYIRFTDSLVKTLKDIEVGDESTVQSVGSFVIPAIKVNSLYISQPSIVMLQ